MHVFTISSEAIAGGPDISLGRMYRWPRRRRSYAIALVAIGVLVAGAIAWRQLHRPATIVQAGSGATAVQQVVAVQRPSIAVLPLLSLSTPTEADYFADGLTEALFRRSAGFQKSRFGPGIPFSLIRIKHPDLRRSDETLTFVISSKATFGEPLSGFVSRFA